LTSVVRKGKLDPATRPDRVFRPAERQFRE
jgi:hypothetical protein